MSQSYMIRGHYEERRRFLECHCEERSDEAISKKMVEIATLRSQRRIAALPSVARNDNDKRKKIQHKKVKK